MDEILREYIEDMKSVENIINLIDSLRIASAINIDNDVDELKYKPIIDLHNQTTQCKLSLPILPGTLVLYLGGRFEFFVKTIFEELCLDIASRCNSYKQLPRSMRENLLKFTAEVIANPRKYGHGDKGVESFIRNTNDNVNLDKVDNINSVCLSITYENMRPETLKDLFERIGAQNTWTTLAEQAEIKVFLKTNNTEQAKKLAQKHLNDFMDIRNKIAHPSKDITWPDIDTVRFYMDYLIRLGTSIKSICQLYAVQYENNSESAS